MQYIKRYTNRFTVALLLLLAIYEAPFDPIKSMLPSLFNTAIFAVVIVVTLVAPFATGGKLKEAYDAFED